MNKSFFRLFAACLTFYCLPIVGMQKFVKIFFSSCLDIPKKTDFEKVMQKNYQNLGYCCFLCSRLKKSEATLEKDRKFFNFYVHTAADKVQSDLKEMKKISSNQMFLIRGYCDSLLKELREDQQDSSQWLGLAQGSLRGALKALEEFSVKRPGRFFFRE